MIHLTQLRLVSIQVSNLQTSSDFYTKFLNLIALSDSPANSIVFEHENGAAFVIRKAVIELSKAKPPGAGVALWFAIADLEAFRKKNIAQITIVRDIHPTPFGNVLVIADPDGYSITLNEEL